MKCLAVYLLVHLMGSITQGLPFEFQGGCPAKAAADLPNRLELTRKNVFNVFVKK